MRVKDITVEQAKALAGQHVEITVWYMPDGHGGQGGYVKRVEPEGLVTEWGAVESHHPWTHIHHVTADDPFAADDCMEYDPDLCTGPVDYFSIDGRGSAPPRCEYHVEQRLKRYEDSIERYAYSTTPPSWFDPSYAGESWD